MLHSLVSIFLIFFVIYGIDGFGVVPSKLSVRVNETFEILCYVDRPDGELNFYADGDLVPETYITRTNKTCIQLRYRHTRPVKKNYTCRQNIHNVGDSDVMVDKRMAPVRDFKCRTTDLIFVNCSFRQPPSFHIIQYNLRLAVKGDKSKTTKLNLTADGRSGYSSKFKVPNSTQSSNDLVFHFKLHASNTLHNLDETFDFKLFEILKPREIQNLTVMNNETTFSRAFVTFALPKELEKASEQMIFDVRLKLTSEAAAEWKKIQNPSLEMINTEAYRVTLDNLDFQNTLYTVKIRTKSKSAADVDSSWSPGQSVNFTTISGVADTVPETCDSCFNVMDNGNAVIYWKEVPKNYQNADEFSYLVVALDDQGREVKRTMQKETSMAFSRNEFNASKILIKIYSKNKKGTSKKFSHIQVPLQLKEAKALKLRKQLVNDEYEISWKFLSNSSVESFTVFWCNQQANELPNQCDGVINFQVLPATEKKFSVSASESKQFGVSANVRGNNQSRGFEWAECTAAQPNQIGLVNSFWSTVDAEHSLRLHWKLNCVDEAITVGYDISYCLIDESGLNKCNETVKIHVELLADDNELSQYDIPNLKSYQLYNVSIALKSPIQLGVATNPITVRTMEAAPTAPRDLKAIDIEQNSISLTWNRPLEVNGEAITYQLWYNERKININRNETMNGTFLFTLDGLESFTNYLITVVACTSDCSNSSDSIIFKTAISAPSVMMQPKLEVVSNRRMVIRWDAPQVLGGNLDYFQLKQEFPDGLVKIYQINGGLRSCVIDRLTCETELNLSIRGVNLEHSNVSLVDAVLNQIYTDCFANPAAVYKGYFYGVWSEPIFYSCRNKSSAVLIVIISSSLVLMICSAYLAVKMYHKIIAMKAIHAELPEGLDITTSSPSRDTRVIRDLDLVRDHVLNNIDEEEEIFQEQEKLIAPTTLKIVAINEKSVVPDRESIKSETFLPFILNPKTNEITYELSNASLMEKLSSQKMSPSKAVNSHIDTPPPMGINDGYTKMYQPQSPFREVESPIQGYLDMSGKTTSPVKKEPPKPVNSGYTTNEIKMFIEDSEANKNGYIGKRTSILADPTKKHQPVINSNGYVQNLK